jgi:hypothetical protein
MTKKTTLLVSILGVVAFYIMDKSVQFGICQDVNYDCRNTTELIQSAAAIFLVTFIFSLITYKLPEQVFRYWFKFAVWFVPFIIVVTTWVDTLHSGGGWGTPDLTSALVYILLYSVFVGISFVRIFIAWWEVKTGQVMSPAKKIALTAAVPILIVATLWLIVTS